MKFKVLYNPLSGNGNAQNVIADIENHLKGNTLEFEDVTGISDAYEYISNLDLSYALLIAGGDGTLNRFINGAKSMLGRVPLWYYASGNGNDFWSDLGYKKGDKPICIDEYVKDLPEVTVNGKSYLVLNGVGFGIDGYCCEVGDKLRAEHKKVDYTAIAVKGLLFHFKPRKAEITVDGVKKSYKKVWIAPAMNGRMYGGGMIPTPAQNRLDPERKISLCVMYGAGKLRTLMAFPSIFKGEHIKKKIVEVVSGREITVKFDKPTALQIDGETILGVTEYTMKK